MARIGTDSLTGSSAAHQDVNGVEVAVMASWGWVKAMLKSIYDQPDADAVHAQFDRGLRRSLPGVRSPDDAVTP
jgi:hypothetical protein